MKNAHAEVFTALTEQVTKLLIKHNKVAAQAAAAAVDIAKEHKCDPVKIAEMEAYFCVFNAISEALMIFNAIYADSILLQNAEVNDNEAEANSLLSKILTKPELPSASAPKVKKKHVDDDDDDDFDISYTSKF